MSTIYVPGLLQKFHIRKLVVELVTGFINNFVIWRPILSMSGLVDIPGNHGVNDTRRTLPAWIP